MSPNRELAAARALLDSAERLSRSETGAADDALARRWLHAAGVALAVAAQQGDTPEREPSVPLSLMWDDAGLEAARQQHEAWVEAEDVEGRQRRAQLKGRVARTALGVLGGTLLAVLLSWGVSALLRRPNLLANKPWVASSEAVKCHPERHECGGTVTDIFFHTNNELNPWVRFDFGEPTTFSKLSILNRQDMGRDRAAPLAVEVSDDAATWREVARRPDVFTTWSPSFESTTARYLRLRVVDKSTWFHLEDVEAYR